MQTPEVMAVRRDFLKIVNENIEAKVNRGISATEKRAIGFVIDKKWDQASDAGQFMGNVFGVTAEDTPKNAAWKVHNGVYSTTQTELASRLAAASQDREERGKLQAIGALIEDSHKGIQANYEANVDGIIALGGIPEYWLPAWIRQT